MTHPVLPSVEDLLALIGDGIITTNEEGRIILFNRAAEEMFGFTAAEVMDQRIEMLLPDRFHQTHQREVREYAVTATAPRTMGHKRDVVGRRSDGSEFPVEAILCRRIVSERLMLTVAIRDVTEHKLLEEQRQMLNAELHHRIKNIMAVVSSIVSLSARASSSVSEFREALLDRLLSMERSNSVLLLVDSSKANLLDLLNIELAAYRNSDGDNVVLEGPTVSVPARLVIALSLILHELATNSAKHGALGKRGRQVSIGWSLAEDGGNQRLSIRWRETGGTGVTSPATHGFGTKLIEHSLCKAIRGRVKVDYHDDGLDWRMVLPLF